MAPKKTVHSFSIDKTVDKSGSDCRNYAANLGLVPRAGWCKEQWRNNINRQRWVADRVYSNTPKLWWMRLLSSGNIHDVSIPATMNLLGTITDFPNPLRIKSQKYNKINQYDLKITRPNLVKVT
jgi:hypothetical protein